MTTRILPGTRTVSVCALVPYPPNTTPSQRYRIEQWMPYLLDQGIEVDLFPFADDSLMRLLHQPGRRAAKAAKSLSSFARRVRHLAAIPRHDVVLIHRAACIVGPAVLERSLRFLGRPVIFDFDDAIYLLHTTAANRRLGWLKFPGKTAALCRLSRHVVVGNNGLADYARQFNPRVSVIPSSVDTDQFRPASSRRSNGRVVIGWTGSSTSQTYLEMFAPVLRDYLGRRDDVELRVHSDREPILPGVPFVWRPWSPETEAAELGAFDIGIMPMPDNPWARGKCAMKALLSMAMGTPTLCSAVGTNREVIQHGENGLLASTPEEWWANLDSLVDDPALRDRLGRAGRETVEQSYSMQSCASQFARVVRGTLGSDPACASHPWQPGVGVRLNGDAVDQATEELQSRGLVR